ILTSLDLAKEVAGDLGPEKILAKVGGPVTTNRAGSWIHGGLVVAVPPKSDVIRITFTHPDSDVVQPVVKHLIDSYLKSHEGIHGQVGLFDDLTKQTDELRTRLLRTEQELRSAKTKAGITSLDDARKFYDEKSRLGQAQLEAEAELAEKQS